MASNPKNVTIYGRLSWPVWTAKEAYERSLTGQYPAKDVASAQPSLNLLVEQAQYDKFMSFVENEFFPYCIKQHEAKEKRDALSAAEVKKLLDGIKNDLDDQMFNTPVKPVNEKTAPMAPEAVASIKVIGTKGVDLEQKAIVREEGELLIPEEDLLSYPVLRPISQTVHQMYPGCYVGVTLNLYAYHNDPKRPGFGAGASVAVFKADGDRLGGGVAIDEDEIFAD